MQKIALILVLGCVSACSYTGSWGISPKLIAYANDPNNANDTVFLKGALTLEPSTKNSLINLEVSNNGGVLARSFIAQNLQIYHNDTVFRTVDIPAEALLLKGPKEDDYVVYYTIETSRGPFGTSQETEEIILNIASKTSSYHYKMVLTYIRDINLKYTLLSSFVHHNRFYVIYSDGGANVKITGTDAGGNNINTFTLTNNSTAGSAVTCVGLGGLDSAKCLFLYSNGLNKSIYKATVNLKSQGGSAPNAEPLNLHSNAIPKIYFPLNFDDYTASIYSFDGTNYFISNSSQNFTQIPIPVSGAHMIEMYPFNNQLVLIWKSNDVSDTNNYTIQYITYGGQTFQSTNSTILTNVTKYHSTMCTDGSLYVVYGNSTNLYIGQVWGPHGIPAFASQSTITKRIF